jgi:hypothetical protein
MYREHLPIRCGIRDLLCLGVVCDKPLQLPKGNSLAMLKDVKKLLVILRNIKKTL